MSAEEWITLSLLPSVLWVATGPLVVAALGVWCARRTGRRPLMHSVLVPFEPVAALGVAAVLSRETGEGSLLGYLYVFVMGLTLLPWLLGYGITRVTRAVRTPQARHVIRLVRVTAGLMTRDRGCQS